MSYYQQFERNKAMNDNEDFVDAEIVDTNINEDNLSKVQWRTKNKQLIYIKDMEDSHIRNTALFLMGMGYDKCRASEPVRVMWLRVFRMEWERRMMAKAGGRKRFIYYPESHPDRRIEE